LAQCDEGVFHRAILEVAREERSGYFDDLTTSSMVVEVDELGLPRPISIF
jgi:hypothetical protein